MAQHPLNSTPSERRANLTFAAVIGAVILLGIVLILLNASQQDRLSTVRQTQVSGQKTATGQRTDQTQLTCALWALLHGGDSEKVGTALREAADRICSDVPTPTPSN